MPKEKTLKKKMSKLKITDLTLRDGHQSLYATRMRTEDMLDLAAMLDEVGFHSLEVWGGATFDVMHRFLQENPFDRLRQLKKVAPKTPFQMLLRGQNLVGYRNYPDDVVESFIKRSADLGMDIFRVFDALNDPRNLETACRVVKECGRHFQACICYTITERRIGGPIFNEQYYIDKAKQMAAVGADSLCIKDMAGMLNPEDARLLVRLLKENTGLPVQLHTHYTSGMGTMAFIRAIDAGVDIVDCCVAPFALRTSHPSIEPIQVTYEGTDRDPGLDVEKLVRIGDVLEKIVPKYRRFADTSRSSVIDTNVLIHQIPGGMTSNMVNHLRQADALDRMPEVLEELPRTRRELGTPPLVTPTSQIIGTQAVMNVLMGRYKVVSQEVKDLCFGLYGRTPTPIDPEVQKTCLKGYPRGENPIEGRPADILEPEMPAALSRVGELQREAGQAGQADPDSVLIYALYPRTGEAFLRWRLGLTDEAPGEQEKTADDIKREDDLIRKVQTGELVESKISAKLSANARSFLVSIGDEVFDVLVEEPDKLPTVAPHVQGVAPVSGPRGQKPVNTRPTVAPKPAAVPSKAAPKAAPSIAVEGGQAAVTAPMPGTLLAYSVKVGDVVCAGQLLLTLEAMKMENQIPAPRDGKVVRLGAAAGSSVAKGEILLILE